MNSYRIYYVKQGKKSRRIEEPCEELKQAQKKLIPLFEQFKFHPSCTARKNSSISSNAEHHSEAKYVLRIDIKSCYHAITKQHVLDSLLKYAPDREDLITAIDICFIKDKNGVEILPTGAPTSPILCNIALTPIDYLVKELAKKYNYKYTRYIDDLHLSTTQKDRKWALLNKIKNILVRNALKINHEKSKWSTQQATDEIIITGVRTDKNYNNVPRDFNRMIRSKLQNLAIHNLPIDPETQGCLAYIRSIDEVRYHQFLEYFERRKQYDSVVKRVGTCTQ